jgi:hypothetical protein
LVQTGLSRTKGKYKKQRIEKEQEEGIINLGDKKIEGIDVILEYYKF